MVDSVPQIPMSDEDFSRFIAQEYEKLFLQLNTLRALGQDIGTIAYASCNKIITKSGVVEYHNVTGLIPGKAVDIIIANGGVIKPKDTFAPDGVYLNPTSITIKSGKIVAIS
jgi:hypothetical protein